MILEGLLIWATSLLSVLFFFTATKKTYFVPDNYLQIDDI